MGAAAFRPNQLVSLDGARYTLLRKVDANIWQLEDLRTKRIIERDDNQLRRAYVDRSLVFHNDGAPITSLGATYREVSPEQMEAAKIRRMYVMAVLNSPSNAILIEPLVEKVWQKMKVPADKPSARTVQRWKSEYLRHDRDIHALLSRNETKGNRSSRYGAEVEALIDKAIDQIYMTPTKGTIQETTEKAMYLIKQENDERPASMRLPFPGRDIVAQRIRRIPAYDRCVCREGYMVARKRFRSVLQHRMTSAPLERAEIDHSLLDVFVIDEEKLLPLGRPWLTVCIDDNTRNILGIHISFQPPSYITTAKCLRHAFLPKVGLKEKFPAIKGEWEAHGIMAELSMDNGVEFHSVALENACLGLGIEMHYSPRKTPWFKGKVERVIGTIQNDLMHTFPGTTFSNFIERGDYDPEKHAVISLGTLQHAVHLWVVDYYHNKPHRTLQATPIDIWRSRISIDDIRVPEDPTFLDAVLGRPIENRTLSQKGIEHERLLYNSPELTALRFELGETLRVEIRVDDSDMGQIIVLSPDKKRMFVVPAVDREYATGLTLWQHKIVRRYAAEVLDRLDPMGWIEAKETIRNLVANDTKIKKGKARVAGARFIGETPTPAKTKKASPGPSNHQESEPILPNKVSPNRAKYEPVLNERAVDYT